jgi:hypothetical protein
MVVSFVVFWQILGHRGRSPERGLSSGAPPPGGSPGAFVSG